MTIVESVLAMERLLLRVYFVKCDRLWENLPYGIFVKIEFDASMISSTIELTRVQVLD